jgi:hypothetical protein
MEEWLPVVGYEDKYEVSSLGQVRRRINRKRIRRMKAHDNGKGYLRVYLFDGWKGKPLLIHRLVSEAFLGPRPENKDVHHKDTNKQNNGLVNLCYVDRNEHSPKGEQTGKAKITEEIVREIRKLRRMGHLLRELGDYYGISRTMVGDIVRYKNWNHVK